MQMLVAVKTESSSPTTGETSNTLFTIGTNLTNKLSLLLSVLSIVSSCRYQLELFSNLCVGRTRVQLAIQAILPIEIIFRCVPILSYPILTIYLPLPISVNNNNTLLLYRCMRDEYLPPSLRATYCKVFRIVHLNSHPQAAVAPVEYARKWHNISSHIRIAEPR